jgi:hypothetical protein
MTIDILLNDADKHSEISKVEDVLAYFVDSKGICGHDHSFKPAFEGIKTSIDVIPKLFGKVKNASVST